MGAISKVTGQFVGDGITKVFVINHLLLSSKLSITILDPNGVIIHPAGLRITSSGQIQIDFGNAAAPINGAVYKVIKRAVMGGLGEGLDFWSLDDTFILQ